MPEKLDSCIVGGGRVRIGDIKHERRKSGQLDRLVFTACPSCGLGRWKKVNNHQLCRSCASKRGYIPTNPPGEAHSQWRGGRIKTKQGYIRIWLSSSSFFYGMTDKCNHTVLEHRLVMAIHLNRCLLPWEVVHHKNGIKDDNCLENLELLPTRKSHLSSIAMVRELKHLQKRVTLLEAEIVLLKIQLEERNASRI